MTKIPPLPASLCQPVLNHLSLPADPPPTLETLQQLVTGYTRAVPWESASRIMRRARHQETADCVLLGEAFWESHFETGAGGTCYESNYAFFGLLRWLGYEGYLTLNDMDSAVGCHSAIVILHKGGKYLVDVGFPVYAIIPITANAASSAQCPLMNYQLLPQGGRRYLLRRESIDKAHSFILNNTPIAEADYRAVASHDYRHDGGQFLNEIVIQKIVAEQLWRYHSEVQPPCLQQFVNGKRHDHLISGDVAGELAQRFGIAREILSKAIDALALKQP